MYIFGVRLRAGTSGVRVWGQNVGVRSFRGLLIFINFILLFNFKFTTLMLKKTSGVVDYRVRRRK